MINIDLYTTDTNTIEYYLLYIGILVSSWVFIILITKCIKSRDKSETEQNLNQTVDVYAKVDQKKLVHNNLSKEESSLRFKFLLVASIIKAATWIKAPYVFALFNRLHQFDRSEIGILYAIDNVSSLLFGPIFGVLCDMYGRKKFCIMYCLSAMTHVSLRLTGSRFLAYPAQIVTGFCSCLMELSFESWLNFEASLMFKNTLDGKKLKNAYLREIFTKQTSIDCYCSLALSGIATLLYINYGIFYPFYACIAFEFIAMLIIIFTWRENDMEKLKRKESIKTTPVVDEHNPDQELDLLFGNKTGEASKETFWGNFKGSARVLGEKLDLLYIGIIDSLFKIGLQLFLFIWVPLLEETSGTFIHPGAIFVCFMFARLIGAEFLDLMKSLCVLNNYVILLLIMSTATISFFLAFYVPLFSVRFFAFVYFEGLSGVFMPLLSTLRSQLIPEKYRTSIMNFFRIPINIFSILSLVLTSLISTYQICFIGFIFLSIGVLLNLWLIFKYSPYAGKVEVFKTSDWAGGLQIKKMREKEFNDTSMQGK